MNLRLFATCLLILFSNLFLCSILKASDENFKVEPGLFYGYAVMNGQTEKYPIFLDIEIDSTNTEAPLKPLIAFLKIKLGGFTTHEFIPHYYLIPNFNWNSRIITLDANNNANGANMTMRGVFSEDGKILSGKLIPLTSGITEADFILHRYSHKKKNQLKNTYPNHPVIRALTGEYKGDCNNKNIFLQIEAIRHNTPSSSGDAPFGGVLVQARTYTLERSVSDFNYRGYVFYQSYSNLQYIPFLQELHLPIEKNEFCNFSNGELKCANNCILKKLPVDLNDFDTIPEQNKIKENQVAVEKILVKEECSKYERTIIDEELGQTPNITPIHYNDSNDFTKSDVLGYYYGNLHVESRNIYKPFFLRVEPTDLPTLTDIESPLLDQRNLSILGNIFSGVNDYKSSIPIQFQTREFPKNAFEGTYFYGKDDFDMSIQKWTAIGIEGKLFSKTFGLIGSFQLRKFNNIEEIKNAKNVAAGFTIAGDYSVPFKDRANIERRLYLKLSLRRGGSFDGVSRPSYFPFTLDAAINYRKYYGEHDEHGYAGVFDPFASIFLIPLDNGKSIYGRYFGGKFGAFLTSAQFYRDSPLVRQAFEK